MTRFEKIVSILKGKDTSIILIDNIKKEIKASILLCSQNYPDAEYIKTIFTDGSFLLIMLNDHEMYYADNIVGYIRSIPDESIGIEKTIMYQDKLYKLGNVNDYQFVKQLYTGNPFDIEGECRFSDYFPTSGLKEFLSLGWLMRTGQRADINPVMINLKEIQIQ